MGAREPVARQDRDIADPVGHTAGLESLLSRLDPLVTRFAQGGGDLRAEVQAQQAVLRHRLEALKRG